MFGAPISYHQLAVMLASQEKLAFQGVDAIKWTYRVMSFRPMNGPAIFINFIHSINSVWKELAQEHGVPIDDNMNTKIICRRHCQLGQGPPFCHCLHRMSIEGLPGLSFISELMQELHLSVTFQICGHCRVRRWQQPCSVQALLQKTRPAPETVCDAAKFIGLAQFYLRFIPNFELRIAPLRDIIKQEFTNPIAPF